MSNISHIALWLALLASPCLVPRKHLGPKVIAFIHLLTRASEPTLAEFEKFSGECCGESELAFELKECQLRGWGICSEACIVFTRRCTIATRVPSLELNWLRDRFDTVGQAYRLISIESLLGYEHIELIEIQVGNANMILYHDASMDPIGGWLLG